MLALVGSGEYLPDVEAIDRALLERLAGPVRVVCLPTAAGLEGERVVRGWMERGVAHFTRLGVAATGLPVIDNTTANRSDYAEAIDKANFVYLSGGHPKHLYDSLASTPVWDAILAVHQRGGVVAGCSAGAMIMGQRIVGPGTGGKGFGLLSGSAILPHFDEFPDFVGRIARMVSDKSVMMVGLDGRTALVVEHGRYHVLGRGYVTLFTAEGKRKFAAGMDPSPYFLPRSEDA